MRKFRDMNQVKGMILLIPNEGVLDAFTEMNIERLKQLVMPKAKVLRYKEGNFCSNCDYEFRIDSETGDDESGYHYCVNCLEELLCCDDEMCDRDNERLDETVWAITYGIYREKIKYS